MKNFTIATLLVGLVSFGGGKAFIPVYERLYVQEYKIINHQQLQEYVGYAVAFPGAISPMLTGLVGFINFGILGFILGILLLTVPSLLLVFCAYTFLKRWQDTQTFKFINLYLQAVILALLLSVVVEFITPHVFPFLKNLWFKDPVQLILYVLLTLIWIYFFCVPKNSKKRKIFLFFLGCVLLLYLGQNWNFTPSHSRNLFIYIASIVVSLIALMQYKVHPFILILISGAIGVLFIYL